MARPVSGFVFDRSARELRPILGIPGASLLGDGLDVGGELTAAYVAPGQNWALATTAEGPVFLLLARGAVSRIPVDGVTASPERVAFRKERLVFTATATLPPVFDAAPKAKSAMFMKES